MNIANSFDDGFPLHSQQQQLILRLPEDLAHRVKALIKEGLLSEDIKPLNGNTKPILIDISPKDADSPSNDFTFSLEGKDYPSLLLNLPCPLETHKTFDNKIFLKSGDVGQMLQVFHTEKERDSCRSSIIETINGDYYQNGITPPTFDVVKRRFELTRKNETHLPYRIRETSEEINLFYDLWTGEKDNQQLDGLTSNALSGIKMGLKSKDNNTDINNMNNIFDRHQIIPAVTIASSDDDIKEFIEIFEEVVDFEDWMADNYTHQGITIIIDGNDWTLDNNPENGSYNNNSNNIRLFLEHPEILMTEFDIEEDRIDELARQQKIEQKLRVLAVPPSQGSTNEYKNESDVMEIDNENQYEDKSLESDNENNRKSNKNKPNSNSENKDKEENKSDSNNSNNNEENDDDDDVDWIEMTV
eukprot:gene9182-12383_t